MKLIDLNLPGENDFFMQEAYKSLRTNLQFCGKDIKVICVTSCNENEGKSVVSLHTAKSFAELGKKVLFIDADMRKSVIASRNASVTDITGLSEVLTGMATLENSLCKTKDGEVYILFSGKYPPNPVELLGGRYFEELVKKARDEYDYVIIDTPPIGKVVDAAVVATTCDGAVLVFGDDKISYRDARTAVDQLEKSGCNVLGVVKNRVVSDGKKYRVKGSKY